MLDRVADFDESTFSVIRTAANRNVNLVNRLLCARVESRMFLPPRKIESAERERDRIAFRRFDVLRFITREAADFKYRDLCCERAYILRGRRIPLFEAVNPGENTSDDKNTPVDLRLSRDNLREKYLFFRNGTSRMQRPR